MLYNKLALVAAAATAVHAQDRPEDEPICDFYTKALLEENTAENQATLLTLVVNTVVIGNYTEPNVGIKVPGILAPGKVDGVDVELMPYFDGTLKTTNKGGNEGESVNFLDGGGAEPLMENKPSNDEEANQFFLLTHLYQFFGALLGCSMQGMAGFDSYEAAASMFEVHKFMNLNHAETTYFIQQVGMAAASFGVADSDVEAVGKSLNDLFNVRCAPPVEVIPGQGEQLQSICIDEETCPLAEDAVCKEYEGGMEGGHGDECTSVPMTATHMVPTQSGSMDHGDCSSAMPTNGTMTAGPSPTASATMEPTAVPTAGAAASGLSLGALLAGVAAFAL